MQVRGSGILVAAVALVVTGCARIPQGSVDSLASQPESTITTTPSPAASPLASAAPSPGTASWQLVGSIQSPLARQGSGEIRGIGFERGYVVSDSREGWFSADGVSWKRVRRGVEEGVPLGVRSLASDGERVLIVGEYTPCTLAQWQRNPFSDCRGRPGSWVSDDGETWSVGEVWTGPLGEPGKAGSEFSAAWPVPTGGWDAAQLISTSDESDDLPPTGPALWHSDDGRTWSLLTERLTRIDAACPEWDLESLMAGADPQGRRALAATCDEVPFLWASEDGAEYAPVAAFSLASGSVVFDLLPPGRSGPWLVAGASGGHAVVWRSSDLGEWEGEELPVLPRHGNAAATRIIATDAGYLAIGSASIGDAGEQLTWLSANGTDWRLIGVQPIAGLPIWRVATGPAGILGFGTTRTPGDGWGLHVWRFSAD